MHKLHFQRRMIITSYKQSCCSFVHINARSVEALHGARGPVSPVASLGLMSPGAEKTWPPFFSHRPLESDVVSSPLASSHVVYPAFFLNSTTKKLILFGCHPMGSVTRGSQPLVTPLGVPTAPPLPAVSPSTSWFVQCVCIALLGVGLLLFILIINPVFS